MRTYLAGPMTGKKWYNVEVFDAAAAAWRAKGHTVVTPFDANSVVWRAMYGRAFDPRVDVCDYGDPLLPEMLAADFAALCRAEAVALLPEWASSKGSRAEILVAVNLGKPIYDAVTFERLPLVATVLIRREAA